VVALLLLGKKTQGEALAAGDLSLINFLRLIAYVKMLALEEKGLTQRVIALFLAGALFSLLAAACAFVITYEEYKKHFLEKRRARLMAWRIGIVTFIFFMLFGLLFVLISPRILNFKG